MCEALFEGLCAQLSPGQSFAGRGWALLTAALGVSEPTRNPNTWNPHCLPDPRRRGCGTPGGSAKSPPSAWLSCARGSGEAADSQLCAPELERKLSLTSAWRPLCDLRQVAPPRDLGVLLCHGRGQRLQQRCGSPGDRRASAPEHGAWFRLVPPVSRPEPALALVSHHFSSA